MTKNVFVVNLTRLHEGTGREDGLMMIEMIMRTLCPILSLYQHLGHETPDCLQYSFPVSKLWMSFI